MSCQNNECEFRCCHQKTFPKPILFQFCTLIQLRCIHCATVSYPKPSLLIHLLVFFRFPTPIGFVQRGKSSIHANKFGSLKIEDDESYYGDSFHFNGGGSIEKRQQQLHHRQRGTKENVLFNDTNKNNDDDPRHHQDHHRLERCSRRERRRKTLSRRHPLKQHQQREAARKDVDGANNSGKNINTTGKAQNDAGNMLQQIVHFAQHNAALQDDDCADAGAAQDARQSGSAYSNYRAEKLSKSILLFLGGVCQQGMLHERKIFFSYEWLCEGVLRLCIFSYWLFRTLRNNNFFTRKITLT